MKASDATSIEGDAFHRYDRADMKIVMQEEADKGNNHFSHFGPEANRLEDLENVFRQFSEDGTGRIRNYVHDEIEAEHPWFATRHIHTVAGNSRENRAAVL